MRPFSVLSGDAVVIHSRLRIIMKPVRPVNAIEEAEAGAEVGAEQHVDRPEEEHDRRDHDEDAEDRRVPDALVEGFGGEGQRHVVLLLQRSLVGHDRFDLRLGEDGTEVRHAARRDAADAVLLVGRARRC